MPRDAIPRLRRHSWLRFHDFDVAEGEVRVGQAKHFADLLSRLAQGLCILVEN